MLTIADVKRFPALQELGTGNKEVFVWLFFGAT
jgi:hypothetical protein